MTNLVCFGFGYCAEHYVAAFGQKFDRIVGTVRGAERAAILNAYEGQRLQALLFDGVHATADLRNAIATADCILVSVPPGEGGDPVLTVFGEALEQVKQLGAVVYLSTIGVYGDRGGAWVDEATEPHPDSGRGGARLTAERAWQRVGERGGASVAVLRLAGIYGPGQNALEQVARGKARRVLKPGQIFNRIHVGDIAQAVDAAFTRRASGVFNIADDEPTPPGDPIVFAAQLLAVAPPPEIPFAQAAQTMSPMALSFWQECRRVKNDKLKRELGVTLRYPTYREGLQALFVEQQVASLRGG
ncbi:MAG TPA: SDR family oxidoreductase [Xanthobacteraceae bacterium]|jgi:nucleoside-diphosphate-sugar epimerase|nr:SDR family oxidoreductase [Xanthobacteraceae bacterium]